MAASKSSAGAKPVRAPRVPRETIGRDRVMQAALNAFLQRGYGGTSMKSLAQELGISAPALYWYFASKEEMYVSVIQKAMEDFLDHVRSSVTAQDPVRRLGQYVRAHVTFQLLQADVARAFDLTMSVQTLGRDIPRQRLEPIVKMEVEYVREIRDVLRQGVSQGTMTIPDVKTTAFAIIALCEYVHTWFHSEGELTVEAVAQRYEALAWRMVAAAPPDPLPAGA